MDEWSQITLIKEDASLYYGVALYTTHFRCTLNEMFLVCHWQSKNNELRSQVRSASGRRPESDCATQENYEASVDQHLRP